MNDSAFMRWVRQVVSQWTLRGMLLFVTLTAAAAAIWRYRSLPAVLSAYAAMWMSAGLARQSWDAWRYLRSRDGLSRDERFSLLFSVAWPFGLSIGMLAYFVQSGSYEMAPQIVAPDYDGLIPNFLLAIAIVCMLASLQVGRRDAQAKSVLRLRHFFIDALATGASFWIALLLLTQLTIIPMLVNVTITGIENWWPLRFTTAGGLAVHRHAFFLHTTELVLCLSALAVAAAELFGRAAGPWKKVVVGSVMFCAALASAYGAYYLSMKAYAFAFPAMSEGQLPRSPAVLLTALALIAIVALIASCRFIRPTSAIVSQEVSTAGYYHRGRVGAVLIILGFITVLVQNIYWICIGEIAISEVVNGIAYLLTEPAILLWGALLITAVGCLLMERKEADVAFRLCIPVRPRFTLLLTWLALTGAFAGGGIAAAQMAFAAWTAPWFINHVL